MPRHKPGAKRPAAVLACVFWLAVWQIASMLVGERLFLPYPGEVLATLWGLLGDSTFYSTLGFSFARLALGFFAALIMGSLLAYAAYKISFVETLLRPLMALAKAAPAATFTMLLLIFFGSRNISAPVVFIMVLPLFYSNLLTGAQSVDPELFEAAAVFGMLPTDRFRFIYLPYVTPFFLSSCEVGWGMSWKAGVSAEVIAITAGSVGGAIYDAKITLETADLFAYTLVVIIISLLLEKLTRTLICYIEKLLTD
ncbi:MAG: ABC transporter permease subunit [Oscillospiraceae bacterium]|jgi:NitT/TauT family transport system permease protein|nr:ABC transporter permease subunit [Oscillospiraceae bacterium]